MTMYYRVLYRAMYRETGWEQTPAGLVVEESGSGPQRAVSWDHLRKTWRFNPEAAARNLYDPQNRRNWDPVDRATAERIAREVLKTELPSEETLHQMCVTALGEA
jgi:hypothetical protein